MWLKLKSAAFSFLIGYNFDNLCPRAWNTIPVFFSSSQWKDKMSLNASTAPCQMNLESTKAHGVLISYFDVLETLKWDVSLQEKVEMHLNVPYWLFVTQVMF